MCGPARKNALAAYAILMACVVLAWALCLAGAGVWPFGVETLAPIDNMQQQAPDFGAISRLIEGSEGLGWSYASGGAVRNYLTPFSHNVLFPTTWLAWLMPWGDILQALSWQLLFQLMLAAGTCCWYLRRRFRRTPWLLQVALAFSYAFSHFFLTKYICLNFLNISAVFPLFLAALDSLLFRGRAGWYVIIMVVMMAFAGYFAWMFGLFALVYAFADLRPRRVWAKRSRLTLLVGATLLSLAISCVFWLPDAAHMALSSRASAVSTDKLLDALVYPDEVTFWTLLPTACASLLVAPSPRRFRALLFSREGLASALICLGLLLFAATFVWCMGAPMCFMSRFSYMVGMLFCCMACRAWGDAPARGWGKRYGMLLLIMGVLVGMGCRTLRYEPHFRDAALWGFCIGGVAVAVMCTLIRRPGWCLAASMAFVVAVFQCFHICHREYFPLFSELRMERVEHDYRMGALVQKLPLAPGDRIKSVDLALMEHAGEYAGFNRFSNNYQSATSRQKVVMRDLGYLDWWTRVMDVGGTIMSDSFLGTRYMVAERPSLDGVAPCVYAGHGLYVYENPFYWGVGALVELRDMEASPPDSSSLQHQQALYNLLSGSGSTPLFRGGDSVSEGLWLYCQSHDDPQLFKACISPELQPLGGTSHDRLLLQFHAKDGAPPPSCCILDANALAALSSKHKGEVEVLQVVGDGLDLRLHPKPGKDLLIFPLLYHEGYRATCAGRELEVVDALGFAGVKLPAGLEGAPVVELRFDLPCRGVGGIVSVCGCLALLLFCLLRPSGMRWNGMVRHAGAVFMVSGYAALAAIVLWTAFWGIAFIASRL